MGDVHEKRHTCLSAVASSGAFPESHCAPTLHDGANFIVCEATSAEAGGWRVVTRGDAILVWKFEGAILDRTQALSTSFFGGLESESNVALRVATINLLEGLANMLAKSG